MNQVETDRFHNDLKPALLADVPRSDGAGKRLSVNQVEELQQQFGSVFRGDQQSSSPLWQIDALPKWYGAALTVFARTGSMLPVLEGLHVRPSAILDVYRALRWTIVYLLVVASMALIGLIGYELLVVPKIESFRADLFSSFGIEGTPRFDVLAWLPAIIFGLATLLVGAFWMLKGGIARSKFGLGCRRYIGFSISATVLRIAQSLVRDNVAIDDAVSIGFALTGAESDIQREVQAVLPASGGSKSDLENALGQSSDYMRLIATQRLDHLRRVTPVFLTAAFGGSLVLAYCAIVFWPFFSMLIDLPMAGA